MNSPYCSYIAEQWMFQSPGATRISSKPVRLPPFLQGPIEQYQPADQRKEVEQLPPAAFVDVVQAATANGDGRENGRQRKQAIEGFADQSGRQIPQDEKQEPPPVFGTGGTPGEVRVLRETGLDRFAKCHFEYPRH